MQQKSYEEVKSWIVNYLASEIGVARESIAVDTSLTNLGVTSRQAVALTGELEDFVGKPVDPVVAWEHPTIHALATYLTAPGGQA